MTQGLVSYLDAGSHAMKGKTHPMQLWAAQSVLTTADGFRRIDGLEAPLIGRTRELRLITEQFHGVQEDGRPCLIIVSGDPGVGKTRLGWEFDKYVDGLPGALRWHSSRCPSYGEGIAFHALADMIRGRLQARVYDAVSDAEGPDQRDLADEALVEQGLDRLGIAAEERAWLEPRLCCLLGIGAITSYAREDLFHAWATFFQRIGTLGDDAATIFLLLEGEVQVVVAGSGAPHRLTTLPAGSTFGESALAGGTRSADIIAITDGEVAELRTGDLHAASPELRAAVLAYLLQISHQALDRATRRIDALSRQP